MITKRALTLTAVLGIATASLVAGAGVLHAGDPDDDALVRGVVDLHVRGIVESDEALLRQAWDVEAADIKRIGPDEAGAESVSAKPITDAFALWTAKRTAGTTARITEVDVLAGRIATVELELTWNGSRYVDLLTLLKVGDRWRIVAKVYVERDASPRRAAGGYGG